MSMNVTTAPVVTVLDGDRGAVGAPKDFIADATRLVGANGVLDPAFFLRKRGATLVVVMNKGMEVAAQGLVRKIAEHLRARAIDECAAALGVHAENPFPGRLQQGMQLAADAAHVFLEALSLGDVLDHALVVTDGTVGREHRTGIF
jgi:hypothetical protein